MVFDQIRKFGGESVRFVAGIWISTVNFKSVNMTLHSGEKRLIFRRDHASIYFHKSSNFCVIGHYFPHLQVLPQRQFCPPSDRSSAVRSGVWTEIAENSPILIEQWLYLLQKPLKIPGDSTIVPPEHNEHLPASIADEATQQALESVRRLSPATLEDFARCVILRTAQWAMDARRKAPAIDQFRHRLLGFAHEMLAGADRYRRRLKQYSLKTNGQSLSVFIDRPVIWTKTCSCASFLARSSF